MSPLPIISTTPAMLNSLNMFIHTKPRPLLHYTSDSFCRITPSITNSQTLTQPAPCCPQPTITRIIPEPTPQLEPHSPPPSPQPISPQPLSPEPFPENLSPPAAPTNSHSHRTRKPNKKKYYNDNLISTTTLHPIPPTLEPSTHNQALNDPKWRNAMDYEFNALLQNKTWDLVPPSSYTPIGCKWVFSYKTTSGWLNIQIQSPTCC